MRLIHFCLLAVLLMASCGQPSQPLEKIRNFSEVVGRAKVLEVNQDLATCVLEIQGQRISAYWQPFVATTQPGSVAFEGNGYTRHPVGAYQEPVQHPRTFEAKPGDTIQFRGIRTGNEILLSLIEVVKH